MQSLSVLSLKKLFIHKLDYNKKHSFKVKQVTEPKIQVNAKRLLTLIFFVNKSLVCNNMLVFAIHLLWFRYSEKILHFTHINTPMQQAVLKPFTCQSHKMIKHTQTIHRLFADNRLSVWPFCEVDCESVKKNFKGYLSRSTYHLFFFINLSLSGSFSTVQHMKTFRCNI